MASIKKRPDGKYRARYRSPDGREHARHFDRKIDAQRWLATVQADIVRGAYVDPDEQTTVTEEAWAWLARRSIGGHTRMRYGSLIRNHIEAVPLGSRRLTAVRPSEAQAWATDRGKVLAPATLRKLVMVLRSIYSDAVLDRRVAASPVVRLTLPRAVKPRVVPLSVEQLRALVDAMAPRYRAMVIVQAGLGLRIGELLGLRVADVDFLRRTVRIEHQADVDTRDLVQLKTERSYRTLLLPAVVSDALASHLAKYPAGPDMECACQERVECSRSRSGLIFHTSTNRPYDHYFYGGRIFGAAVATANATGAVKLPAGTTTHDLRHHFASVLLAAGESVVAVAEWLGHDGATLVLTTYGHLMPHSDDRMRKAIDAAWTTHASSGGSNADSVRTEIN